MILMEEVRYLILNPKISTENIFYMLLYVLCSLSIFSSIVSLTLICPMAFVCCASVCFLGPKLPPYLPFSFGHSSSGVTVMCSDTCLTHPPPHPL